MLKIWTNPAAVARRIYRMLSVPPVGGYIESRREFLTAKPTPYKRGSSGSFPFQKKVKLSSLRHPLEAFAPSPVSKNSSAARRPGAGQDCQMLFEAYAVGVFYKY